jgi:hypothetical protein
MTDLDSYERWRRLRAAEAPRAGFADDVMARLNDAQTRQTTYAGGRLLVIAWLARRQRAFAFTVAGAAFLLRLAAAFSLFSPQ